MSQNKTRQEFFGLNHSLGGGKLFLLILHWILTLNEPNKVMIISCQVKVLNHSLESMKQYKLIKESDA